MKICFETLGCKVNQYETQALETILSERGHSVAAAEDDCDVCVINTCTVTAESARKSRQAVRRAMRAHPGAFIAVCGCLPQISPGEVLELGADFVAGSGDRLQFAAELERLARTHASGLQIDDPGTRKKFELLPAGGLTGRTRAMLKIQDGCDNFCSYCIIPYARGLTVRSIPLDRAVGEALRLQKEGYSELVITGIEISSWGKDLGGTSGLAVLVTAVAESVPGMRIRLGSLEPNAVTQDFCTALSPLPNVCGHFHLSLQSGCDETLRRMRRRYDTDRFAEAVQLLRHFFPGCAVTADLIVGFPGETEEEFRKTLSFIERCAFSSMHIFPYSVRPGTAAAVMETQIEKSVRLDRARRARTLAKAMERRYLENCVGKKAVRSLRTGKRRNFHWARRWLLPGFRRTNGPPQPPFAGADSFRKKKHSFR